MKLVRVTWLDHYSLNTELGVWNTPDAYQDLEPAEVVNVGWVINETDSAIALAASISGDHYGNDIIILKQLIKNVEVIEHE